MLSKIRTYAPIAYSLVAAAVFLDSLRYKFTNAVETQVIFGRLDAWAASFGAKGLFAQTGLFSQYVIGSAELLASSLLLLGLFPALRRLQTVGALIAVAVMTGAVNFHLWTPLGIDPNNDGGGLLLNGGSEQLADANDAGIETALVDGGNAQDTAACVH